jgi:hypothetical protein
MRIRNNTAASVCLQDLNARIAAYATVDLDTITCEGSLELQGYVADHTLTIVQQYSTTSTVATPADGLVQAVDTSPNLGSGPTSSRPTATAKIGQMYYDTTLHLAVWYNGSGVWHNGAGSAV